MKRDARIGLAVVLVLGLAVTLLVGRAIFKRGTPPATPAAEGDDVAGGDAPTSTDVRHDTADAAPLPATAHADSPAVKKFISDETAQAPLPQPAPTGPAAAGPIAPTGAITPRQADTSVPGPLVNPNGIKPLANAPVTPAPRPTHDDKSSPDSGLEDHESPTPTPAVSDAPSGGFGYTVRSGDNMWKISSAVYGDGKYTQKIVEANAGMNTQKLKPGTVIKIPAIANKTVLMKLPSFADAKAASKLTDSGSAIAHNTKPAADEHTGQVTASSPVAAPPANEVPAGGTTHKVESGETLGSIAKKYYGSAGPKSVAMIVAANKGLEPTRLKVGMELTIPAKK